LGAAWPAIAVQMAVATAMACDDLPAEAAFFAALQQMTMAVLGDQGLTLTGSERQSMVFARSED